eukprot:GFKZ01007782.1.p1 GENE.GFKZ01007782.1~~GFKZ01007782.1.p1  ORF type:complete len:662 (-),score=109.17 GFKZ01007782.1:156-2141(-)
MPHSKGHPRRNPPLTSIAPASSSRQRPPIRPPERPLRTSHDPMKKRFLRAWDEADGPTPRPPTAVPPPPKRRRYPKLLITDKDGNLVANPLRNPPNNSHPAPLIIPSPHAPSAAQSTIKPSPTPPKTRTSFDPSLTSPRRPLPCDRALRVAGAAPLIVRPVFTDRNGETFSMVFRPKVPFKMLPNPLDDIREPLHLTNGIVQVEQPHGGGGGGEKEKNVATAQEGRLGTKILAAAQEGGEDSITATQEGGGKVVVVSEQGGVAAENGIAKGQAGQRGETSFAKRVDGEGKVELVGPSHEAGGRGDMNIGGDGGGEGGKILAASPGGGARTGQVFNPTAIAQRPVKESKSVTGEGEGTAVSGDGRVIQVGRRSGTVHYWRSSLQMPKRRDKVLGATQPARGGRVEESKREASGGNMKSRGNDRLETERGRAVAERVVRKKAPVDMGAEHEFPRAAPPFPMDGFENTTHREPGSSSRPGVNLGAGRSAELDARMPGPCPTVSRGRRHIAGERESQQIREGREGGNAEEELGNMKGVEAQKALEEERNEIRRLHLTKNYEIRKLEAYAESRYHVKMNLRGKQKLENWLSSEDTVASNSVLFIVLVLNLDRRLVSKEGRDRREALADMNNEHLRMLEALMARTSTRDGYTNWGVLTANFRGDRTA